MRSRLEAAPDLLFEPETLLRSSFIVFYRTNVTMIRKRFNSVDRFTLDAAQSCMLRCLDASDFSRTRELNEYCRKLNLIVAYKNV